MVESSAATRAGAGGRAQSRTARTPDYPEQKEARMRTVNPADCGPGSSVVRCWTRLVLPDPVLLGAAELEVRLRQLEAEGAHLLEDRLDLALARPRSGPCRTCRRTAPRRSSTISSRDLAALIGQLQTHGAPVVRVREPPHPTARLDAVEDARDALRLLEEQRRNEARLDRARSRSAARPARAPAMPTRRGGRTGAPAACTTSSRSR